MSCKKSQGFLETHQFSVSDRTDATKQRYGREAALQLAKSATKIVVGKRKSVVLFDMTNPPDDDTLASELLGPTGNLKAPTLRQGDTLYVGFSEQAYQRLIAPELDGTIRSS